MADMTGQVALVTGGTCGIGLAICERLIGRGIKVAAGYAGRHDPAQQFADKYADCGVSIHGATSALTRTACGLSARSWTGTGSRDLRALTRTRARLAQDQARHQGRVEKILEALLKTSVVISDLFGASAAGSSMPWLPGSAPRRRWPRWGTNG
jgi:NAD(P)-dependent dehydrogenase (short-subunit alcohol dehydrogenase family)